VKRLAGRTPIESALRRLDDLTQNEALMVAARNLRITDSIYNKVDVIEGGAQNLFDSSVAECLRLLRNAGTNKLARWFYKRDYCYP
jgi:hypothetical protein